MAVHIFIALCTWKPSRNSWQLRPHWNAMNICLQGKTKAHCSKESTGPTVSSRVGEPNRLHAKKLSRLPGLPYLPRRDNSPPWIVSPSQVVSPISWALSIRPKIPEFPGCGANGTDIFRNFFSEILGVPREVGLNFRKIGITGKFHSIRPFLLGPSFSEPGNRNSTWLILKLLNIILVRYQTKDRNILLQRYCSGLAWQALVSSAKIQELPYVKCEHNRSNEQLARHSKVTLELVRKIERYRKCSRGLLLNSYDKSDIVTLT